MTVQIPLSRGLVALVDDADAELVSQFKWCAIPGAYTWYASRWFRRADGRTSSMLMHKMLTGWARTDHINGNGLDNERANLRPATAAQNVSNMRKSRGTSRFKGVCWNTRSGRWHAHIEVGGRQRSLGYHVDETAAALAYDAAARESFGEFAALNFPMPGEQPALVGTRPRLRARSSMEWRRDKEDAR